LFWKNSGKSNLPPKVLSTALGSIFIAAKQFFNMPSAGREITAGQRTMSGQNAELSGQILTLPVSLTGHFR
jgi:hypothetical protein